MPSVSSIVDTAFGNAASAGGKLADDFDDFLVLLTAQLQAQDPLDPLDSNEFTNQLVQFTGVEQQVTANKNLENVTALLLFNGMNQAVNYLGKTVTLPQEKIEFDGEPVTWLYELEATTKETTLEVVNKNGAVVLELEGQIDAGMHSLNWDGSGTDGNLVPPGEYTLRVKTRNGADESVPTNIFTQGVVEGLEMEGGQALLNVLGQRVPLTEVVAVGLVDKPPAP